MSEYKSIRKDVAKLAESEFIVKYGLLQKATQVLIKFIAASEKDPEKFLTFAEVRRNFRSITTDEVFAITGEFEKLKLIETRHNKTKLVMRFNVFGFETNEFDQVRQEHLKNYISEKTNARVERARKVLKEFEEKEKLKLAQKQQQISNFSETKTPFELHEAKECDSTVCRFCALEQDKAIGF